MATGWRWSTASRQLRAATPPSKAPGAVTAAATVVVARAMTVARPGKPDDGITPSDQTGSTSPWQTIATANSKH
jgi:hypothetical protein